MTKYKVNYIKREEIKVKRAVVLLAGLVFMMFAMFSCVAFAEDQDQSVVLEDNGGLDDFGMPMIGAQDELLDVYGVLPVKNEFMKDVERLGYIHLLPDQDINWEADATWADLAGILAKMNEIKPGIVPEDIVFTASTEKLTYADLAKILLQLMKNKDKKKDADAVDHLNKLGIKVNKVNIYDNLSAAEMAHLFYKTLHQKQLNHDNSILQDLYIDNMQLAKHKILKLTRSAIEMEYIGTYTLANGATIFQKDENGELTPISYKALAVGMKNAYLIVDSNNLVKNVIVDGPYAPRDIRVLLSSSLSSTGGSTSYDFASVKLSGDQGIKVLAKDIEGDHVIADVAANVPVTFTLANGNIYCDGVLVGPRAFVAANSATSQTTIYSTTRGGKNPKYDGNFEIAPSPTVGKLNLINELYMEDYLHRVVPSEMPGSWAVEALKAQAVAARSYAYNNVLDSGYESQGANVDDSVNCQVYNNSAETANVIVACDGTAGIIMTNNGECITAYYSSTGSGYSAANENVWHNSANNAFPGVPMPYCRALPQIPGYTYPSWTDEAALLAYFKEVPRAGYDFVSPYYRWWINMTRTELENTINKNMPGRRNADKVLGTNFVQTIAGPDPLTPGFSIGKLLEMKVIQRGEGGNIMILEIRGTNGTWRILKEYNIRFSIKPTKIDTSSTRNIMLNFHTGTASANYSILPSSFFSFEVRTAVDGSINDVTFYGGGNGHGVGMSQYGAKGMAERGLTFDQILHNFYSSVELTDLW